jgi:hypothetical protein
MEEYIKMKNLNPINPINVTPEMRKEIEQNIKPWRLKKKVNSKGVKYKRKNPLTGKIENVFDILSRKTYTPTMKDYTEAESINQTIYEAFDKYYDEIKGIEDIVFNSVGREVTDSDERAYIVKSVIGERDTMDWLDDFLFKYISTRKYADKHGVKKKSDNLSENDSLSRKLSGLSNYILEHDEYKILSDAALENRSKREVNTTFGDFEATKGQISINTVEGFTSPENQKDARNKVLTRKVRLAQKKLTDNDFNHPEYGDYLEILHLTREQLRMELGLHPSQTKEEKEVKKEQFLMRSADNLNAIKKEVFDKWDDAKSSLKSERFSLKEMDLHAPLKEGEDKEKKFSQLAYYYGRPLTTNTHYGVMVKLVNALEDELFDIKERLRRPIKFKKIAPTVSISRDMFEELDFVFAGDVRTMLLTNQKGTEQYNQNYSMLKNQFDYKADSSEFWTLQEFEKAVKVGKESLDQMEIDIVDILMDKKRLDTVFYIDAKGNVEDNILNIIKTYIELVHDKKMTNQQINLKIDTISNTIADEEARRQEIVRIKRLKAQGKTCKTIECTSCGDELPPNEDYFNKDIRSGGYRKKCKKCVKNKK